MAEENNVDPMAEAIKKSKPGATAAEVQAGIETDARAKADAVRADELATLRKMGEERKEREALRPLPPITQATPAHLARPGEDTVTMFFPHALFVWAEPTPEYPKRLKVAFAKGMQEVPVSMKDNWYLKASGVEEYEGRPAKISGLKPDPAKGIVE